ncbi:23608_t:CDS:2, partial [Racocetra persica]
MKMVDTKNQANVKFEKYKPISNAGRCKNRESNLNAKRGKANERKEKKASESKERKASESKERNQQTQK